MEGLHDSGPEVNREELYRIIRLEFRDERVLRAQRKHGFELQEIVKQHAHQGWLRVMFGERDEEQGKVSVLSFQTNIMRELPPAEDQIAQAAEHLFDWFCGAGIYEVDAIYAGTREVSEAQHSSNFIDKTAEANTILWELQGRQQSKPPAQQEVTSSIRSHIVWFELPDERVVQAQQQKEHAELLHNIFRNRYQDEDWSIKTPEPLLKDGVKVACFGFGIMTFIDSETDPIVQAAAMHLFEWLEETGILDPKLSLAELHSQVQSEGSKVLVSTHTEKIQTLFRMLEQFDARIKNASVDDFPLPEG